MLEVLQRLQRNAKKYQKKGIKVEHQLLRGYYLVPDPLHHTKNVLFLCVSVFLPINTPTHLAAADSEKERENMASFVDDEFQSANIFIPEEWSDAADSVAYDSNTSPPPVAFVCGPKNSGKTTFSRVLVNVLLQRYLFCILSNIWQSVNQ